MVAYFGGLANAAVDVLLFAERSIIWQQTSERGPMGANNPAAVGWRIRVQEWLVLLDQDARRRHAFDMNNQYIVESAYDHGHAFPSHVILSILKALAINFAIRWIVRNAINDGAAAIGLSLDNATVDALTDVAVIAI
jgi:hypothetical protein